MPKTFSKFRKLHFWKKNFLSDTFTLKLTLFFIKSNFRKGLWSSLFSNSDSKGLFWTFWAAENGRNLPKQHFLNTDGKFDAKNVYSYLKFNSKMYLLSALSLNSDSKYLFWPFWAAEISQILPKWFIFVRKGKFYLTKVYSYVKFNFERHSWSALLLNSDYKCLFWPFWAAQNT